MVIPRRTTAEEEAQEQTLEDASSETSTIAAPSEPETPATSHAPSESDSSQVSTPATPAPAGLSSPKATVTPTQHTRRDTRTAIAVPNIPGIQRPKPSPPVADKQETVLLPTEATTTALEEQKAVPAEGDKDVEEDTKLPSPPPKPAPKSWADLVKRNNAAAASAGAQTNGVMPIGPSLPKSASLAEALRQYSTQIDPTLSFLEPRGLVNTGNMCYMNAVSPTSRPHSSYCY